MLPQGWRLQVKNETGTSIDVEVKYNGKKIDSNGALSYAGWSADLGITGLANGGLHSTARIDNGTNLYLAADIEVTISNFGATPSGQVIVYFQAEAEANGEFPPDELGFVVAVDEFTTTGTKYLTGEV